MKRFKSLKYLTVLTLPMLAYISFTQTGWLTYLPVLEAFALIPILELFFKPDPSNISPEEEERRKSDWLFDAMVYSIVPVQFYMLWVFLNSMGEPMDTATMIGRISGMGMLCGVMGINVAHELGHRSKKWEQWMAQALLMTSLYMHFFIEHNRGHHKNVSTHEDPSSARAGESLYRFWLRSVTMTYFSAWKLEAERLAKKQLSWFHWSNQMLQFQLVQIAFLTWIYAQFGWQVCLYFVAAAVLGFLLLETVNYIEHYGLQRQKTAKGHFERVMPMHSWNSNHQIGRLFLFELSRHSDHHFMASRKYQILRYMDESPQMPTGYPGMMLLATLPPLWFKLMQPRIQKFNELVQN